MCTANYTIHIDDALCEEWRQKKKRASRLSGTQKCWNWFTILQKTTLKSTGMCVCVFVSPIISYDHGQHTVQLYVHFRISIHGMHRDRLNFIHGLQKFELYNSTKTWHKNILLSENMWKWNFKVFSNFMHLYHVHTKINIPSLNKEDQHPREECIVIVIRLLIKRAAVNLANQHGQIPCTNKWYFCGETKKCPFTCCLFSSVIKQFCVTHKLWFRLHCLCKEFHTWCGQCHGTNVSWLSNTVWTVHKHKHSPL
jgi:hypothetical protein